MALTQTGVDQAEVTHCYEVDQRRDGVQTLRPLPWVFLLFGNAGEERYVVPTPGPNTAILGESPTAPRAEYMRHRPFPHETDRPAGVNTVGDLTRGGPVAIHFFGGV